MALALEQKYSAQLDEIEHILTLRLPFYMREQIADVLEAARQSGLALDGEWVSALKIASLRIEEWKSRLKDICDHGGGPAPGGGFGEVKP